MQIVVKEEGCPRLCHEQNCFAWPDISQKPTKWVIVFICKSIRTNKNSSLKAFKFLFKQIID